MTKKIIGIGNAIVDILCKVDDSFLIENNLSKGSMSLIDDKTVKKLGQLKLEKITSGGSASNTISTLGQLGINTKFIGKVADDHFGNQFISEIKKSNVDFIGSKSSNNSSGQSFILITNDAQRTMRTFLGCAPEIYEKDINSASFDENTILYLEGYLWDREETILALKKSIKIAKENKSKIAFSLSDAFCVARHRKDFLSLIDEIDILFANESEILELFSITSFSQDDLEKIFSNKKNITVAITRSEKGCVIINQQKSIAINSNQVSKLIDTTGAGDCFAAGFLYGIINNLTLEKSASIGNLIASKIIQKFGARFEDEEIKLLKIN